MFDTFSSFAGGGNSLGTVWNNWQTNWSGTWSQSAGASQGNISVGASVSGTFTIGEDIVGSTSGASHALRVIDTEPDNDPFADNFEIETQADNILDFSEQNPFGIP